MGDSEKDVIKISKSYIDELVCVKLFQSQFIQEQGLFGEFTKWFKEKERDILASGIIENIEGEDE